MAESIFVVLRETGELLLIALAIHTFLGRTGRLHLLPAMRLGFLAGFVVATPVAAFIALRDWSPLVDGLFSSALGLATLTMAIAMLSSREAISHHARSWITAAGSGPTAGALATALFAGFAVVRETLEVGVFLRSIAQSHGWADTVLGALLGLVGSAVFLLVYRSVSSRFSLHLLFRLSTLLLCLLAVQLIVEGVSTLVTVAVADPAAVAFIEGLLTPGTTAYWLVCALLSALPVVVLVRTWWHESVADDLV